MDIKKLISAFLLLLLCVGYNSCSKDEADNVISDSDYAEICKKASDIDYAIVKEYFKKSESLEELMKHADEIKAINGVEDVYSDGTTTMFVKIKDFRTMCYSYYPKLFGSKATQQQIIQNQIKAYAKSQNDGVIYSNQDKVGMDMLIIAPTYKDDELSDICEDIFPNLLDRFSKAGFQKPKIVNSPDANVEFFRNGIFDCDYLFIITHGKYDPILESHWLMTSVEIPRDADGRIDPKFYENYKDYSEDQVRFDTYYEEDQKYVDVSNVIVSEKFIDTSSRQFNHPGKAIVFNVACQSMKGPSATEIDSVNFSMSRVFELKGAGAYLGYDETNGCGPFAGLEFWTRLLSGMSVNSAYENLTDIVKHFKYDENDNIIWADLKLHAPQMKEICINQPEITYIDSSDDNGLKIDLYARSFFEHIFTTFDVSIDDYVVNYDSESNLPFRYGFELSKSEDFTDVISLGKKRFGDEGCTWDTDYGKIANHYYMLSLSQSLTYNVNEPNAVIEPETTYWARAYVFDGTGYSYSSPISFTTGEYNNGGNGGVFNGHEYVDLGLPSGTLWATVNVGANSPEEYGDYFAWGETSPKQVYYWNTYKWSTGSSWEMTKYCTNDTYGRIDGKTELELADDAAYVNWGSGWRMPSEDQLQELIDNCTTSYATLNGVKGSVFYSKHNDAWLFFPAAGWHHRDDIYYLGYEGFYRSRTLAKYVSNSAQYMNTNKSTATISNINERYGGMSVRAVISSSRSGSSMSW